jgi:hypothetical protein
MAKPKYLSTFGSGKVKFYVHSIYIYLFILYIFFVLCFPPSEFLIFSLIFYFSSLRFMGKLFDVSFYCWTMAGECYFVFLVTYIIHAHTQWRCCIICYSHQSASFSIQFKIFFFVYFSRILTFLKTIVCRRWIPTTETDWWATSIYIHAMLIIMSVNN